MSQKYIQLLNYYVYNYVYENERVLNNDCF